MGPIKGHIAQANAAAWCAHEKRAKRAWVREF